MSDTQVHIFMCLNDIVSDTCYTDENKIRELVDNANEDSKSRDFWYKTLFVEQ